MDKNTLKNLAFPFLLILIVFGVISLSIALFSEISENVVNQQTKIFDKAIIDLIQYNSSPKIYDVMIFITELGSVWFISVASLLVILYLWFKERDK